MAVRPNHIKNAHRASRAKTWMTSRLLLQQQPAPASCRLPSEVQGDTVVNPEDLPRPHQAALRRRRPRVLAGAPALFIRGSADSQIAAQVGGCSIDRPLEIKRRHEPARLVHQIYDGRVVHGVATLIEWDLFEIDP